MKEHIQTIFISVAAIALGTILTYVISNSRDLGALTEKADNTEERINRIVAVLPDIRIKLAKEELNKKIKTAVITTRPRKLNKDLWKSTVHVVDITNGRRVSYNLLLNRKETEQLPLLVSGRVLLSNKRAVSFSQLDGYLVTTGKLATTPKYINSDASFVSH